MCLSSRYQYVLAIDTAMTGCQVVVFSAANSKMWKQSNDFPRGQAEHLVPMLESVLRQARLEFKDLNAVVCTMGPGAFTGLRVGLSTAKALSLSLDIPLYGITTLQALAYQYVDMSQENQSFVVLVETKRSDFYYQFFSGSGVAISEPGSAMAADICTMVEGKSFVCVGDAVHRFDAEAQKVGVDIERVCVEIACPDLKNLFGREIFVLQEEEVLPVYLRTPDVSVSKKKSRILSV